jgi:hypothetical protein
MYLALTRDESLEHAAAIDRQLELLGTDDPAASDGLRAERDQLLAHVSQLEADDERAQRRAALQEGFARKACMAGRTGVKFERGVPG